MIALVKAIKDAGMKPKLWVAPLAVDPGTDLLRDHADMLLLDKHGKPQDVTWWDSFYLCPAYPETVERSKALVRKIMGDWGYAGLKIDGQHLNGVAPCWNPAHKHARPEESVEKLQDFWKAIYEEAIAIDPGRGDRNLPLRHLVRLSQHALHEPGGGLRSGVVVAGPAQGQDDQGADGSLGGLCRRPCGAQRQGR